MKTIGVLLTGPAERLKDDYITPFENALKRLTGERELRLLFHAPKGDPLNDPHEMREHAAALIAQTPDVIWLLSTSTARAAIDARKRAGKADDIAIVGAAVSSVIRKVATAAGNFSGIINSGWELGDERYRLLKQIMKERLRKVGVLVHPHEYNSSSEEELKLIQRVAPPDSVAAARIGTAADLRHGIAELKQAGADAVMTTHIPLFQHERKQIVQLAKDAGMPLVGHRSFFASDGALMAYSSVLPAQMEQSARMVHRMLSTPEADKSVFEEPDQFELVVNAAAAASFGFALPNTWTPQGLKVRTV